MTNSDEATVQQFGEEWAHFDQAELPADEQRARFAEYFRVFPWEQLSTTSVGFDMGCGSGRWAREVAPRVGTLYCIDASEAALDVARRSLAEFNNCVFTVASFGAIPLEDDSMDFGYCLGVLHHVPDTEAAIAECVRKLKPGSPFLVYMYYNFEFRPTWFRTLWKVCDVARRGISRLKSRPRIAVTTAIACVVYWPLARLGAVCERFGADVSNFPLSYYRDKSFYTMKTDALDRFGTPLEKRYSRSDVTQVMVDAGLENIVFSDLEPYWCAVGWRSSSPAAK